MDKKAHWESIYRSKAPEEVSWFQRHASHSLDLIRRWEPNTSASIIDVGGGASVLVDGLVDAGYRNLTVLELSAAAMERSRSRLAGEAAGMAWIEADILNVDLPGGRFDVWHDRAVFHFLTHANDRERYISQVRCAVKSGGLVLIATFADDGPTHCSGLEVARYSASSLHAEFGGDFELLTSVREAHVTPWSAAQSFVYCLCRFA